VPETIKKLFASSRDSTSMVAVVHLAEWDEVWVRSMSDTLRNLQAGPIAAGRFHAIHAPRSLYPNVDVCPPFCPHAETPQQAHWRSKRNIDYTLLLAYAAPLGRYYLQLEDDISFTQGWLGVVTSYANSQPDLSKESNAPWRVIDFTGAGCLGKMMQSNELIRLAQFMLLFYDQLHCEALLVRWTRSMTEGKPVEYWKTGQKLFQHEGQIDSDGGAHRTQVSCGGHSAPSCSECPQGKGEGFCHGDCKWVSEACISNYPAMQEAPVDRFVEPAPPPPPQQPIIAQAPQVQVGDADQFRHFNNPSGIVVTDMTVVPTFEGRFAYWVGGETEGRNDVCDYAVSPALRRPAPDGHRCWFWAKRVNEGQFLTVVFDSDYSLKALHVDFGHDAHGRDVLMNGAVEIAHAAQQVDRYASGGANVCSHYRKIKDVRADRTVSWQPDVPEHAIRCVRLLVNEPQNEWLIVRRLLVDAT